MSIVSKLIPRLAFNEQLLLIFMSKTNLSGVFDIKELLKDFQGLNEKLKYRGNRVLKTFTSNYANYQDWTDLMSMFMNETANEDLFWQVYLTDTKGIYYNDNECQEPMDVANFLLDNIYYGSLFKCNKQLFLCKNGIMFENDDKEIMEDVIKTILNNKFFITRLKDQENSTTTKISKYTQAEEVAKMLRLNIQEDKDLRTFIDKESKGKLFFENGFYDFESGNFGRYGSATLMEISHSIGFERNDEIRQQIQDKILTPIFNNQKIQDWFMYVVARMLAGHREDKKMYCITGKRDCGKGCLSQLLENCFKKYIATIDLGVFAVKKNRGDVGRDNAFALALEYSRIALMNESTQDELDGNKLKQIFSGGDTIITRRLHHENQEQKIQATPLLFCNETPRFNCADVWEKIYELHLTSKFVDEDYKEEDKYTNINYFPKDDSVKEKFIYQPEVINEFTLMLFEAYKKPVATPECVMKEKENTINELDILREAFLPCEEGFMTNKEIEDNCRKFGIRKNRKQVMKDLEGLKGYDVSNHRMSRGRGLKGIKAGIQLL